MKKVVTSLTITLSAAAHIDLDTDTTIEIAIANVAKIIPVDPEIGIGSSIIFLSDGTTINVLESPHELMQKGLFRNKILRRRFSSTSA